MKNKKGQNNYFVFKTYSVCSRIIILCSRLIILCSWLIILCSRYNPGGEVLWFVKDSDLIAKRRRRRERRAKSLERRRSRFCMYIFKDCDTFCSRYYLCDANKIYDHDELFFVYLIFLWGESFYESITMLFLLNLMKEHEKCT